MRLLRPSLAMLFLFTALTGLAYPLAITGIAQVALPAQANGSALTRGGTVIGSSLIGQNFTNPRYFFGRPSATADAPYNAAASSGSNLGPSAQKLVDGVKEQAAAYAGQTPPVDLVTASGSGLDPHISPAAALVQVERVAQARGVAPERVRALVEEHTQTSAFGLLGQPRVNVLELNLALDALAGT